ncbi:MAG TPA: hypothetical protein VFU65_07985 [Actinocrinis sp.]|nr:hypothetical protein [Actinocrinis sp.]
MARLVVGKIIGLAAVVSVLLGGRWIAFCVQDIGATSPAAHTTGNDALWLGHAWVDGRRGPQDITALAAQVHGTGIRDLFVHVGPLNQDGSLDPALRPQARWFVDAAHRALPDVRLLAWIGNIVKPRDGGLDLEDAQTRLRILNSDASVLNDGFDGVHYDFEPVGDADPGYLALLNVTHAMVHNVGRMLSISAEQVEPVPGGRWALDALIGHDNWWSTGYLRQVASRVDQVAIMSYDSVLWTSSSYSGFVRDETRLALGAVPHNVALLMGVPAYEGYSFVHDSAAETTAAGIRGVRLALPHGTPTDRAVGVALYIDFAATRADWAAYRSDWVDP